MSRHRLTRIVLAAAAITAMVAGTPGTAAAATKTEPTKNGPTSLVYVEVNSNSMLNVGKYTLASDGSPVFDIAAIFAANINYDGSKAYLHFNENVRKVLDGVETQVRPLQQKGIKVVLSILGNHQGAGFANFPSKEAAAAFATQLADAVAKYGLDGIDFDDEYADYGENGTPQPNESSFVYLVSALREKMPDKLITFYNIGPSASRLVHDGVDVGTKFDYAANPYYGSWDPPGVSLPKERLSPAAVHIGQTGDGNTTDLAKRTVNEGYGAFLTYDLTAGDKSGAISAFTRELYGSEAKYTG
ncbi:glycosyl hydrolase family 18 (putative chitinase) [Herbihabitans rhizosphaerae]|uniref:Glycosyl hydrolase family 18 (Putative chitinase) n=1 Tax=Herbihabitans rhizosphaerae TaxID=1872711 RepID=A0A4Q7KNT3_9PSEU|nr:endo-beta-N-acetylglucosaminidase H [Herbihabitans rhizosphaerae]RZS37630.1 glycosyl hydrolase family 18 (putative chitinase) [Herbihabitans rhizosphaerae]